CGSPCSMANRMRVTSVMDDSEAKRRERGAIPPGGGIAPLRSHALDSADAEQVEAALNDASRQVAQQQTTLPQFERWCLQDRAVVEAASGLRQVPQIRRDEVRLVLLRRTVEELLESQQLDRQRPLLCHL